MHTIEIPKRLWTSRLDEISKTHEGWLVSLEIVSQPTGVRHQFHQLPLVGVTAEQTDGRMISIAVEEPTGEHLTHMIHSPKKVVFDESPSGALASVEIVGSDGSTAVLRLRSLAALHRKAGGP